MSGYPIKTYKGFNYQKQIYHNHLSYVVTTKTGTILNQSDIITTEKEVKNYIKTRYNHF